MTPQEFHNRNAYPRGAACVACKAPPVIVCRVLLPLKDVVEKQGEAIGAILLDPRRAENFFALCVETKYGTFVRVSTTYACAEHRRDLERTAAKAPSYALVEFGRGPGEDRPMVGYGTSPS